MNTTNNTDKVISENNNSCRHCRYMLAKPWETPHLGYYCFCESSPHFGAVISKSGKDGPGCEHHMGSTYNDMSFLEALKILTFTPRSQEQMNEPHPYPLIVHRSDINETPHIALIFKDNAQLEEWRDAQTRVFTEVLNMMEERGEFDK